MTTRPIIAVQVFIGMGLLSMPRFDVESQSSFDVFSLQVSGFKRWFAVLNDEWWHHRELWESADDEIRGSTEKWLNQYVGSASLQLRDLMQRTGEHKMDNITLAGLDVKQCVQGPGDMMLVPAHTLHAVINLAFSLALNMQPCHNFTTMSSYPPCLPKKWEID